VKILYLSGFILPSRAAHGVHVMKMCQALAKNGHEVTLFAWGHRQPGTRDIHDYYGVRNIFSVKLLPVARVRGGTLFSLPRLYRELSAYDPKNVLVYARSIYGASLAAHLGFPIIYEAHCPPPHALIHWLEKRLLRGKNLRKLVVISESLRHICLSTYGPIRHIEVCHDAADIPAVADGADYSWPGRADRLQVGYTGHLSRGRGIEIILECARRLPEYDFHIAGGRERDIQHWKRLGGANVHFHGFVQPSLVPLVLSRCDVLLMPARKGLRVVGRNIDISGWMSPMKLFEYMASRRAIIASDLPVLREILNEGNSILVAPDNLDGWVSALQKCEDPEYRDRLAGAAYEGFLANYTWEKRAARALSGLDGGRRI
jgi:glycosyltransferase involved in cell wall biosynthesis